MAHILHDEQPDPTRLGKRLEQLASDPQVRAMLEKFVAAAATSEMDAQVAALSARLDAVAAKATGWPT